MKHVLAALCLISAQSLLTGAIDAQPAVVPTAEGQIGEVPAADTQVAGTRFESIRGDAGALLLGGIQIFGGAVPPTPEMAFLTDMIHDNPDPVPISSTPGTFNATFAVTPASARSRNAADDGDFVAFSFAVDGTIAETMTVNVATFDETGSPLATVPLLNIPNIGLNETGIAVDDQGRATVVYTEIPSGGSPPVRIKAQRLDAVTGALIDPSFLIENDNAIADVALLDPAGNRLLITSSDVFTSQAQGNVVDFQGPSPVVGPAFDISTTVGLTNVLVKVGARVDTGSFVAVWENITGDAVDPVNVRARRFDAMGNPVGDDFIVNSTTADAQGQPAVAVGPNGEAAVAWTATGAGMDDLDVFLQVYDADGNPIGGETRVNTFTDDIQDRPSVRFLPEPDSQGQPQFVVAWRDVATSDGANARGTGTSYRCFSIGEDPTAIFADGFESGDTSSWSDTQP